MVLGHDSSGVTNVLSGELFVLAVGLDVLQFDVEYLETALNHIQLRYRQQLDVCAGSG